MTRERFHVYMNEKCFLPPRTNFHLCEITRSLLKIKITRKIKKKKPNVTIFVFRKCRLCLNYTGSKSNSSVVYVIIIDKIPFVRLYVVGSIIFVSDRFN